MKTKKFLCIVLVITLLFSCATSSWAAATPKAITQKNITKIVGDITEYLVEEASMGDDGRVVKFDIYTRTQMGCKLSKIYQFNKKDKYPLYGYLKKADVQKNVKNLFGNNKIKFRTKGWQYYYNATYKNKKITVLNPGGHFRASKQKYKYRIKKISGKTNKTVVFDCGWLDYFDTSKYYKGGKFTVTLKPANNKYGCIITNIKENWRQPLNSYIGDDNID